MKPIDGAGLLKTPSVIKTLAFFSISIAFFYLGKRWSESDGYRQLIFFSSPASASASRSGAQLGLPSVAVSPNSGKSYNLSSLISRGGQESALPPADAPAVIAEPVSAPPIPPPPQITKFGIIDENGTMSEDFEVGEFDPNFVDDWNNNGSQTMLPAEAGVGLRCKNTNFAPKA